MNETTWHYAKDGQRQGPVSLAELRELVTSGTLQGEDLVWNSSMPSWIPVRSEPSLSPLVASEPNEPIVPPPLATQGQDWFKKLKSLDAAATRFVQKLAWAICAIVVVLGGLLFFAMLNAAETAIQVASAGAMFSTIFIGVYIIARCVEKFLRP
jgi:drug/metabolite transporter (DMT)-like permease